MLVDEPLPDELVEEDVVVEVDEEVEAFDES